MTQAAKGRGRLEQLSALMAIGAGVMALVGFVARGPNAGKFARGQARISPSAARAQQPQSPDQRRDELAVKPLGRTTGYKGALPRNLESYKNDAAGFQDFVSRRAWYGWDRRRKCKNSPACKDGALLGMMRVQAIEDANTYPLTGLPANGVVVGRMSNIGRYDDATTGLKPAKYPDEYYFIVRNERRSTTEAQLYVARLTHDQKTGALRTTVTIARAMHDYRSCGHTTRPVRAEGDFRSCATAHSRGPGPSDATAGARQFDSADAFAWFSCAYGCCTAQWPPSTLDSSF